MRDFYIGIDPGQKGAISIINNDCKIDFCFEMLLSKNKKELDSKAIIQKLCYLKNENCFIVLEKSQAMPKQGVVSTFNYGKGYGKLLAIIEILDLPFVEISPRKWKKEFNLIGKNKNDSIVMAEKLFKGIDFKTSRGRLKDGLAESLLMAEYGRRRNLQEIKCMK